MNKKFDYLDDKYINNLAKNDKEGNKNLTFSTNENNNFNFKRFKHIEEIDYTHNNDEIRNFLYPIFKNKVHSTNIFISGGKRLNECWFYNNMVMIDIDDGLTIEQCIKKLNEEKISYIICPSKSHRKEKDGKIKDRFHVYIPLEERIVDKDIKKYTILYLIDMLKGDTVVKDNARFFGANPNLKKEEIIINLNGGSKWFTLRNLDSKTLDGFEKKIEKIEKKKTKKGKKIKQKCKTLKKIIGLKLFIGQVKNYHPYLIYSHYNESNGSINFYRNHLDKNPGVYCLQNSNFIIDNKKNKDGTNKTYFIPFTLNTYNEIKVCNKNEMRRDLSTLIKEVITADRLDPYTPRVHGILTNEGTGKSYAALKNMEQGQFFCTNTKKRMMEVTEILKEMGRSYGIIYSNADIIYNTIFSRRGETEEAKKEAHKIVKNYENFLSSLNKDSKMKNKIINSLIDKINKKKTINQIYNEIDKISNIIETKRNKIGYSKQEERKQKLKIAALGLFLKKEDGVDEIEKLIIMEYYKQQLEMILKRDKIFLLTSHKMYHTLNNIRPLFGEVTIHMDEIIGELFKNGEVITNLSPPADREEALICAARKKKGFYLVETYNGNKNIIKEEKNLWYKQEGVKLYIYTTELGSLYNIDPDVLNIYDLSHKIHVENLNIIGVQGLNTNKDKNNILQGKERLLYTKKCIKDLLKVDENMIIADGVNGTWNMVNNKGTNKFKEQLKNEKEKKNFAIVINYPNPNRIDEEKLYLLNSARERLKGEYQDSYNDDILRNYLNSMEFTQIAIESIIKDNLQQALGRCCGYRHSDKIKNIYVIIHNHLLGYIGNLNYLTTKIFNNTNIKRDKETRDNNKEVSNFLDHMSLLTGKKTDNYSKFRKKVEDLKLSFKAVMKTIKLVKYQCVQLLKKIYEKKKRRQAEILSVHPIRRFFTNLTLLVNRNYSSLKLAEAAEAAFVRRKDSTKSSFYFSKGSEIPRLLLR